MQVLHFHAEHGNFGDDLNISLWRRVLAPEIWSIPGVTLVGIGTILNADRLNPATLGDTKVYILGSGAGYGRLCAPDILAKAEILAVRGPLTAALVGAPHAAATDGAALLATLPECQPITRTREVSFIPHISSALTGDWERACRIADVHYIDPRRHFDEVIQEIRTSKLVITEAMHGAILSDTLRVPWIPVVTSRKILDLKWYDWTRSLSLDYQPNMLAPTRAKQALAGLKRRLKAGPTRASTPTNEELLSNFRSRYGETASAKAAPSNSAQKRPLLDNMLSAFDPIATAAAGRAIRELVSARPYLSGDSVFMDRLDQLKNAIGRFETTVLGR